MILMQVQLAAADPFFTNDLAGFIKVTVAFGSIASAMVFTLIKLSQQRSSEEIKDLKQDMNGLGERLNENEREVRQSFGELRSDIKAVSVAIQGQSKEHTELIIEMSRAQTASIHKVELEVERLKERANVVDCLEKMTDKVIKTIREVHDHE